MLAHLTPVGWLAAWMINSMKKDPLTGFYLRQSLGLYACFFLTAFIPEYYIIAWGFIFVFYVLSFVGTIKQMEYPVPFLGSFFQKGFKRIA